MFDGKFWGVCWWTYCLRLYIISLIVARPLCMWYGWTAGCSNFIFVSFPELFLQLKGHIHPCQKVARNQIHFQWDNLSRRMIPSWCWCKPLRRKNVKTQLCPKPETFSQQFSFPFNTWIIYFVLGNPNRNIIYIIKINKSFDLILSNSKQHMTWSNYFKLYVIVVNEMIG